MQHLVSNVFAGIKSTLMSVLLPLYMKRLLFLVTLYHYIKKDPVAMSKVDKDALAELNDALKIAKSDAQALVIPGLMTDKIWSSCPASSDVLLNAPLDTTVDTLIESLPRWIIYGRRDDIARDVKEMREFIHSHNAA